MFFNTYFKPYLKFNECSSNNFCGYSINTPFKYIDDSTVDIGFNDTSRKTFFVLYNGVFILSYPYTDSLGRQQAYIYADINYKKQPNVVGKDIFRFSITDNGVRFDNHDNELSTIINTCKKNGTACGRWIELNNWEIPDDYPW